MGISRVDLNTHKGDVAFDPDRLAEVIRKTYPDVSFCLLMGSAADGVARAGSDLDIALYMSARPDLSFYSSIENTIHAIVPAVRVDLGFLNDAEPVFCYEALKGRLLFARNMDEYATFFSRTCRSYERQLIDYERQHQYRMEAGHAV